MSGPKLFISLCLLLTVGLGLNQFFSNKRSEQVEQSVARSTHRVVNSVDDAADRTITAINEATEETTRLAFEREREFRAQEQEQLVNSVSAAASGAVAEQFRKERELEDARAAAEQERLAAQREAYEVKRQAAIQASFIAEGMSQSSVARMAITRYLMENGELPDSNRQAGLPEANQFKGHSLTGLKVTRNGVITLTFNEKSGVRNGSVRLVPDTSSAGGLQWQCSSRSYKSIERIMPQCVYN